MIIFTFIVVLVLWFYSSMYIAPLLNTTVKTYPCRLARATKAPWESYAMY